MGNGMLEPQFKSHSGVVRTRIEFPSLVNESWSGDDKCSRPALTLRGCEKIDGSAPEQ